MRDEILLITRIRTLNKGNQALSAAWLGVLREAFPGRSLRVLERRPHHLVQFRLADLRNARDPAAVFEQICARLVERAPGPELIGSDVPPAHIELDETIRPPARLVALRQRLNLRGWAARFGRYAADWNGRLSAYQRAQLVVLNPAGEFFPREPQAAYFYLLEARIAQLLGARTAIVNHTLDITDPVLRKLIPHVYRSLDLIGFRDEKSIGAYRAMGGDPHNVLVTPDLAVTTRLAGVPARRRGTIAIAINVPEAQAGGYLHRWHDVVDGALAQGLRVELVSNELPGDRPFYDEIQRRHPEVNIAGDRLDYEAYTLLLASYDLVVTSRMHTGILALVAGTPVVPVEGASFKITGLFHELGLPGDVAQPTNQDWPSQVLARISSVSQARDDSACEVTSKIAAARQRVVESIVPRLRSVIGPDVAAQAR